MSWSLRWEGYTVTRRIASTSLAGSKGFTIHPVAPARRARSFLAVSLSVVRTRMGIALYDPSPRTFSIKPKPSILGILMSVIMTSGIAQDLEAVQTILGLKHAIARLRESEHQHVAHRAGIVDCENGLAHLGRSGASKAVMGSPSRARFSPKSGDALAIVKGMPSVFQVMAAERSTCRPWPPTWRTHEAWISTGRPRRPRRVAVSCDTALRSRISGNSTACAGPASAWHWPRIRTPPSSRPGSQRRLPAAGCAGLRCGRSLPFAFGVADLLARAGLS